MGEIVNPYAFGRGVPRHLRKAQRMPPGVELEEGQTTDYSLPHVEVMIKAFKIVAEEGNNLHAAARRIDLELDVVTDAKMLAEWRDKRFSDIWVRAWEEHQADLEAKAKRKALTQSIRALDVQGRVIGRLDEVVETMDAAESAKALDALNKAVSTNTDVLLKHEGRPVNGGTEVNVEVILGDLARMGLVKADVDSDAEEVTDA